jgi:hypothetical protein
MRGQHPNPVFSTPHTALSNARLRRKTLIYARHNFFARSSRRCDHHERCELLHDACQTDVAKDTDLTLAINNVGGLVNSYAIAEQVRVPWKKVFNARTIPATDVGFHMSQQRTRRGKASSLGTCSRPVRLPFTAPVCITTCLISKNLLTSSRMR